jgi:hypothetical protein
VSCVFGVYLFFNWLDGWERFYDQHLDDIGPDRDEGLPEKRRGPIVAAVPYPGGIYVAVDAGPFGYSSILFWSSATNGWHEVYRAPYGRRIYGLAVQRIPGIAFHRLWFNLEEQIYWIPVAKNPRKAEGYPFRESGRLITSWYKTSLAEIKKFFRDVELFSEMVTGQTSVNISYQADAADGEDDWVALPDEFDEWPSQQVLLKNDYSVTGRRLRLMIELETADELYTPRVLAWTINAVTRVPPSKTWTVTFQADDVNVQEGDNQPDTLGQAALLAQIETWANSETQPAPLTMRSVIPQYDNKRVFIESPNIQIREVEVEGEGRDVKAVGNLVIFEA